MACSSYPPVAEKMSTPGRTRTLNLLVRSQTLYPIELRAHIILFYAGAQGFEPQLPEPEPGVLPLDDAPMTSLSKKEGANLCPLL